MTVTQWDFTMAFEGHVAWPYLDTDGNVTVGIGFLLQDERQALALFKNRDPQTVVDDFRNVRRSEPGHSPIYYAKLSTIRLNPAEIRDEFYRRMDIVERELRALFPRWNEFPASAQVALRDMGFNLGTAALRNKWPHLRQDTGVKYWGGCALECRRGGISETRNSATQQLFLEADREQQTRTS